MTPIRIAVCSGSWVVAAKVISMATAETGATRTMAAWKNTNTLLGWNGTLGIKTGSGSQAKYCLVFAATKSGESVMGAVLTAPSEAKRTEDVKKLINYGYARI